LEEKDENFEYINFFFNIKERNMIISPLCLSILILIIINIISLIMILSVIFELFITISIKFNIEKIILEIIHDIKIENNIIYIFFFKLYENLFNSLFLKNKYN
jgi:hypothetical protein